MSKMPLEGPRMAYKAVSIFSRDLEEGRVSAIPQDRDGTCGGTKTKRREHLRLWQLSPDQGISERCPAHVRGQGPSLYELWKLPCLARGLCKARQRPLYWRCGN